MSDVAISLFARGFLRTCPALVPNRKVRGQRLLHERMVSLDLNLLPHYNARLSLALSLRGGCFSRRSNLLISNDGK